MKAPSPGRYAMAAGLLLSVAGVLLLAGLYLIEYTVCQSPTAPCDQPYDSDGVLLVAGGAVATIAGFSVVALWLAARRRIPRPARKVSKRPTELQIVPTRGFSSPVESYVFMKGMERGYQAGQRASAVSVPTCSECGEELPEDAESCPRCGSPLRNRRT